MLLTHNTKSIKQNYNRRNTRAVRDREVAQLFSSQLSTCPQPCAPCAPRVLHRPCQSPSPRGRGKPPGSPVPSAKNVKFAASPSSLGTWHPALPKNDSSIKPSIRLVTPPEEMEHGTRPGGQGPGGVPGGVGSKNRGGMCAYTEGGLSPIDTHAAPTLPLGDTPNTRALPQTLALRC